MAPFIPDGTYKIRNVQFARRLANLANGFPGGLIVGAEGYPTVRFDEWIVKNYGGGGNQITIENWAVRGNFASAEQFQDSALTGSSRDATLWTVVKVDHGYYLQSPNANYVWQLPDGKDYEPIVLVRHTGEDNTKWQFMLVK